MLAIAVTVVFALVTSMAMTWRVRDVALELGIVDQITSSRKVHDRPVPRLGGVGIVAGAYGAILLALALPDTRGALLAESTRLLALAVGGIATAAVGVWDDLRGLNAKKKFAAQFLVALLLFAAGFRLDEIETPFGAPILLGPLSLPVTMLWVAGISNAVNLIDGLDGLAGGIALAALLGLTVVGVSSGDVFGILVAMAVAGGVAGFLFFNVNPASIFMGDTGSLFLGLMLAALALRPHAAGTHGVPMFAMVFAMGVPIADTLGAMLRRALRGTPMFSADREHLHHRLLDAGLPQRQVVIALWGASVLLAAVGVHVTCGEQWRGVTFSLGIAAIAALIYVVGVVFPRSTALTARRDVNRRRFRVIRSVAERLRDATQFADVRDEVRRVAPIIGAEAVWLRLPSESSVHVPEAATARFALDSARPDTAILEILWRDGHAKVDRDTEIAIERLCDDVVRALHRIERGGAEAGSRDLAAMRIHR